MDQEPAKYQSVCNPTIQLRSDSPLPPFESMNNCIEKERRETFMDNYEYNYRNIPWFDFNPEAVRIFKQKWRNYIR